MNDQIEKFLEIEVFWVVYFEYFFSYLTEPRFGFWNSSFILETGKTNLTQKFEKTDDIWNFWIAGFEYFLWY